MKLKFVLFLITIPTLYIYGQYKISGRLMHINNEIINLNSFYITDSLNENYMKIKCDSLGLFSTYTKLNKFYLVINAQNCNIYKNTHTIYSDTNFSIIYLSPKSKYLSSVLIEGKKNNIKYHSEGFEFNVANTELSNLNSLSDLLNFIPNIVVENESNLKINGKDNVAIMINGKINHIANIDIQQILKSIPPRTIKSIKVILNPDISQDANGVSSIIDIRLLSQSQGFIGNISLSNSTAIATKSNCAKFLQ